ncbi:hypothetical protein [Candidatus Mesenet endosymbiont of Phosphuga atrata]|uniref:hypothetical protein n=1 Tax=Candidatus Mesenet endosymbiont of Phosphuga atrata TaxID=3066221 RepID=UPI0030CE60B0
MKYEITEKGRLKITDSKTNKSFKVPKKFSYLKLVEGEDEEYQFTFCTKKGDVLSDYKKYNKVDDKFKYIDTGVINDEEIDLEELYDEERIFSVKPSKTNKEIATIFDIDDNIEIGILSDSMSIGDERKIIAHANGEGKGYVTLFEIIKQSVPDAFNGDGKFKYLSKINDIEIKMGVELKDTDIYNPYEKIAYNCDAESCFLQSYYTDDGTYFKIDSGQKSQCNLKELLTGSASHMNIYLRGIPKANGEPILFIHEDAPLQIFESDKLIFENHPSNDIPVYFPDYML